MPHLFPARDASVPGVPAVELDVTAEVADALLKFQPPAFFKSKPDWFDDAYPKGIPGDEFQHELAVAELVRIGAVKKQPKPPPDKAASKSTEGPKGLFIDSRGDD